MHRVQRLILCRKAWRRVPSRASSRDTFVSKHFTVDNAELMKTLDATESKYRRMNDHYEVEVCKFCNKDNKTKESNKWKLYVNDDGSFHCFRCSLHGSWFDLKRRVAGCYRNSSVDVQPLLSVEEVPKATPAQQEMRAFAKTLYNSSPGPQLVVEYLTTKRCIKKQILLRYGVGYSLQKFLNEMDEWEENHCVTFPWMEERDDVVSAVVERSPTDGTNKDSKQTDLNEKNVVQTDQSVADAPRKPQPFNIVRIKHRSITGKGRQRLFPKGGGWGFFGWHVVRATDTEIVITEGEFDAMAVAQAISTLKKDHDMYKLPVVSLPNGASSLPPGLLPRLERFSKIYLWMDNDESGHVAAEKFSRKLGIRRCVVVRPDQNMQDPPKDANDALRHRSVKGHKLIIDMLQKAKQINHSKLSTFADYRLEVMNLLTRPRSVISGTPTKSLPALTKITKGFREGELVVFTGPTGAGKTTLLSQISLDFARTGAPTLWGSFEIKNPLLMAKMMQQYHKDGNLSLLDEEKLEHVADQFNALPFVFMNFHGGSNLSEILDAMEFAVYQYDIKHIILDNLQFMMSRESGRFSSKFDAQDSAIESFRKFCTDKMVNVFLVIHPRKEDDTTPLQMASILGTAKATQESDVVIILQRVEGSTYIDVKKNRYDGQLGKVNVQFNNITKSFFENTS